MGSIKKQFTSRNTNRGKGFEIYSREKHSNNSSYDANNQGNSYSYSDYNNDYSHPSQSPFGDSSDYYN